MFIRKVKIHNFKRYKDFEITLEEGLNIVVGDNEVGKSTILEAINLALTGIISGKSIWNEISQYIFNKEVGVSFLRFLEIADRIQTKIAVVTDNDGDLAAINKKYENYIGANQKDYIKICVDDVVDTGTLKIGKSDYNYNTLEPKLLKANGLDKLNRILGTDYTDEDDLRKFMKHNKTECGLKIFESSEQIEIPEYILEAIKW